MANTERELTLPEILDEILVAYNSTSVLVPITSSSKAIPAKPLSVLKDLEKVFGSPAVAICPGYPGAYLGQPKLGRCLSGGVLFTTMKGCLINPEMESMTLTSGVAKVKIGGTSVRVVAATTKDVTLVDLDELYPEKHLRYIGMPVTEAPNGATVEAFATEVYGEGESQRITGFFFAGGVQFRAKLKTQHSDSEVIGKTISNKDGLVMVGSICLAQPPMRKATDIEEDFDTEILSITVQQKKSSKTGQSFDAISVVTGIGALWGLGRDVENKLKSMQSKSGLRLVKKGNAIYLSSPSMLSKYASLSPTSV